LKLVGDGPTDQPTDRRTDIVLHRAAIAAKNLFEQKLAHFKIIWAYVGCPLLMAFSVVFFSFLHLLLIPEGVIVLFRNFVWGLTHKKIIEVNKNL
jgi:hypothetical protein